MYHRRKQQYISFISMNGTVERRDSPYADIIDRFRSGGRPVIKAKYLKD